MPKQTDLYQFPTQSEIVPSHDDLNERNELLENRNSELELIDQERQSLLQELRVQRAELSAQNDELRAIHRELDASSRKYKNLFDLAPIGYFSLSTTGFIEDLNLSAAQLLGHRKVYLKNSPLHLYLQERDRPILDMHLKRINQGTQASVELNIIRANGELLPVILRTVPFADKDGKQIGCQTAMMDVSEHKETEEQLRKARDYLQHLAHHDALTDLPNRLLFSDRLHQAVIRARRNRQKVGVLFMDLDRFKYINDSLGHQIGDELLCEVAKRIRHAIRQEDTLARIGGDEFTVIIEGVDRVEDLQKVSHKILEEFVPPITIDDQELVVTSSIGISVYPNDGTSTDDLIKYADSAMYQAKSMGRNKVQFFTPSLSARISNRLTVENELREAIDKDQLELYYQPQYATINKVVSGFEALVRWRHPTRGLLLPHNFIPVAEEIGLIDQIGALVLRKACVQAQKWVAQGHAELRVAVNLSARELLQNDLTQMVEKTLSDTRLDPKNLEMELTESGLLENPDSAIQRLNELRELGVHLAIDDFGTGYSSLSRLQTLPISRLKIDRSFVRGIPANPNDCSIASAIVSMGKNLKLDVVSEGVETQDQYEFLRAQGVQLLQGYYFGRPEQASQADKRLATTH
ncbi:MAG: EAL domain-containing protein [Pseudomonadota bacterium]